MVNESNYKRMATEVLEILNIYPEQIRNKIPSKLINELQKHRIPDLQVNIDKNKKLYEQDVCEETLVMTYMIFRSYIATPEEKEAFDRILNQFDEETRKKYDPNNLFKSQDSTER